jgi:hypothetical protein
MRAVSLSTLSSHLRRKHKATLQIRKQVDEFIKELLLVWKDYDFRTVLLPRDRSQPQPVLPILDGVQCKDCIYLSQSRKALREHANKQHNKKRVKDEELYKKVRVQSWFTEGKERYWIVDESREGSYV